MTTFVRLVPTDKNRLKKASLSPEVLAAVRQKRSPKVPPPVTSEAIEVLLEYLLRHNDLWYEDAVSLHAAAGGAFFALKHAFYAENLVAYSISAASLEEEHIINMLKKRGYWPWY